MNDCSKNYRPIYATDDTTAGATVREIFDRAEVLMAPYATGSRDWGVVVAVHPDQWDRARAALEAAGYRYSEYTRRFDGPTSVRRQEQIRKEGEAFRRAMRTTWFAVGDIAAHEGHVTSVSGDDWTYQADVTGSHGTVLYEGPSEAEARSILAAWEKCDAHERGAYCYAHNPRPRETTT